MALSGRFMATISLITRTRGHAIRVDSTIWFLTGAETRRNHPARCHACRQTARVSHAPDAASPDCWRDDCRGNPCCDCKDRARFRSTGGAFCVTAPSRRSDPVVIDQWIVIFRRSQFLFLFKTHHAGEGLSQHEEESHVTLSFESAMGPEPMGAKRHSKVGNRNRQNNWKLIESYILKICWWIVGKVPSI